jgi:hypothetical protein
MREFTKCPHHTHTHTHTHTNVPKARPNGDAPIISYNARTVREFDRQAIPTISWVQGYRFSTRTWLVTSPDPSFHHAQRATAKILSPIYKKSSSVYISCLLGHHFIIIIIGSHHSPPPRRICRERNSKNKDFVSPCLIKVYVICMSWRVAVDMDIALKL